MSHPDPDDLALGALEGFDDERRRHLEECPPCRDEVESLRHVIEAARAAGRPAQIPLEQPPDAVWQRIADELGLPATTQPDPPAPAERPWWQRPTAWVAAAALVIGALGAVVVQRIVGTPDRTVVATAELQPLPGWDAEGSAAVEEIDGERVLVVDLEATPAQGFREVWLISTDLERLVSLGILTDSEGRFELPAELDLSDFAIVDVSAEPLDGDPAHSGDSIVRGELT